MISVLLVDDQAPVRSGFRLIIDAQEDMEVVGERATGESRSRRPRGSIPTSP